MEVPDADLARAAPAGSVPAAERPSEVAPEEMRAEWERQEAVRAQTRGIQNANLQPDQAPVKHGVHGRLGIYMRCDRCAVAAGCDRAAEGQECPAEIEYVAERSAQLGTVEWLDPIIDGPAIKELVWCEIRLERARRFLAARGETTDKDGGSYLPVAKDVIALVNAWARLLQTLGLTPPGRREMAGKGEGALGDLAAMLMGVKKRQEGEEAEVVEGEFEVEETAGSQESGEDGGSQESGEDGGSQESGEDGGSQESGVRSQENGDGGKGETA